MNLETSSAVGDPIAMISDGNHSPHRWASTSAALLINTDDLQGQRLVQARDLQAQVAAILTLHYNAVINREIDHLQTYPDHCDSDYEVQAITSRAIHQIWDVSETTQWRDLLHSVEWSSSAALTIANHLSTAIHVERLLYADRHPDNHVAAAYKTKFQG